MAFCGFCMNRILILVIMCVIIAYLPGLPSHDMEFTPFSISPPQDLQGPLSVNEVLNGAEHLFVGLVKNPYGFAVANNTLYTGVEGGDIIKIVGDKMVKVAHVGHPCLDSWDERNCGRLLGITFDKHGMLYVVDAYYGIYKVNVHTGKFMQIIDTTKPIEGKMVKVANSVTVANDGTIYWTSSDAHITFDHGIFSFLGDPSGRLYKFDPISKKNTVLMDKIYFAVGIALSAKEDFVMVSETAAGRILRYWLVGPKKGDSEVMVDGLPGLPDSIRLTGKGTYMTVLVLSRSKSFPTLQDLISPYPTLRRFLARFWYLMEVPFELINQAYPNIYTGLITHWIANPEIMIPMVPKTLTVVEFDETGKIVGSMHSTDKRVSFVSDIVLVDKYYYLGSPLNNFLGRVRAKSQKIKA